MVNAKSAEILHRIATNEILSFPADTAPKTGSSEGDGTIARGNAGVAGQISRRAFVKAGVVAGIAIQIDFIGGGATAAPADAGQTGAGQNELAWIDGKGRPKFRFDAIAKVTGEKTFSRDFRATDMPGWPKEQSHAFLIRATKADRLFEDIDLSMLEEGLQPDRVVMAQDLERDGVRVPNPDFYGEFYLVPKGRTPALLGQPVALLIYKGFARFDAAKRRLHFEDRVVRYGAQTGPKPPPHYGNARFVRIQGDTPQSDDLYSPYKDTVISGTFKGDEVIWPAAGASDATARGMAAAAVIDREIASAGDDALVLQRNYFSQSIDPSAMEADNGNGWFDPATRVLHLVVATQSPYEIATTAAEMASKTSFGLSKIDLKAGYTVGYGSKDHTILPYFCVIAALYGDGRPVRLANDRFEQFQMALKRHAFWMNNTFVIDKKTGQFRVM
ncbi:MAG: aldehyde oxidase [Hyphomicrobiales bacterium]|nr:aldehyde oxidase [Hyphomicrobiales bacterium]